MRRVISYIIIFLVPTFIFAQTAQVDSLKKVRITRMYTLSEDYSEIEPVKLDTLITNFRDYQQFEKHTPFYANPGNYGLPAVEIDFLKRNSEYDHYLYRYLKPYMHHNGNRTFIDTQVPFTELKFFYGGPRPLAEQSILVRHSQNVTNKFNLGLDLDAITSNGHYSYQEVTKKAFTAHSSYLGDRYKAFASFSINNFTMMENGGIVFPDEDETGVDDPSFLADFDTRDVPVHLGRLNAAGTRLKNKSVVIVQRYTIGRKNEKTESDTVEVKKSGGVEGTFSHIFSLDFTGKSYSDKLPLGGYYDTAYISNDTNNLLTRDSLYFRVLKNTLRFDFSTSETAKFRLGIGVGIRNELNLYRQVIPTFDAGFADTASWNNSSNAVVGKLYNRIGEKFGWEASGEIWFTGYRAGDFQFNGSITKAFGEGENPALLKGHGLISNTGPTWWQNRWGSNNFYWNNNFGKEVRIVAGGELDIPGVKLNLSGDYSLITGYIYSGLDATPAQYDEAISLIALRLDKNLSFWKMNFNNSLLFQKVSHDDIIPLPLLALKSSFYFEHEFNFKVTGGRLQFQLGVDLYYHTSYYAQAFMPATGDYYNQDRTEIGNYPFMDAFVALKLKRTRIYLAFDHVNQGLTGYNYFMVPGNPMPVRTFKYGFAWTFYN